MWSRRRLGVIAVLALGASAAWASAQGPRELRPLIHARYPAVRWVSTATLAAWLRDEVPPVLLDARGVEEHAVSHLAGARRVDPDRPVLPELAPGARVVVYCSVGWRSAAVAHAFAGRDVYNLEGGIFAWANEGRPVVRDGVVVRAVHPYDATWGRMLEQRLHAYRP